MLTVVYSYRSCVRGTADPSRSDLKRRRRAFGGSDDPSISSFGWLYFPMTVPAAVQILDELFPYNPRA